jgi:hypothetical protein
MTKWLFNFTLDKSPMVNFLWAVSWIGIELVTAITIAFVITYCVVARDLYRRKRKSQP